MSEIQHNVTAQRFEVTIEGVTAFLAYEVIDGDTLNYHHTLVPAALGGRGVAKALTQYALDYAKQHGKKVVPTCSFVARYIERHANYQGLLATV